MAFVCAMKHLLTCLLLASTVLAEDTLAFKELFNGKDLTGWVDVNTSKETWSVKDGLLVCSGLPIGVMRSERQYENFVLHIEWRHMKPGGNSGVFLWSDATPAPGKELPKGLEVQMLELQWPALHPTKDGQPNHPGYVSGELFGANGLEIIPENPRGKRSMSFEFRCKGAGEWNTYDVVAVDGVWWKMVLLGQCSMHQPFCVLHCAARTMLLASCILFDKYCSMHRAPRILLR